MSTTLSLISVTLSKENYLPCRIGRVLGIVTIKKLFAVADNKNWSPFV